MLIGGASVALNGYYRLSLNASGELADKPDVDIWYNPTYKNYYNFLKVIKDLGQDITEFENETSPKSTQVFFQFII
jgi:hypothetical protein